MSFWSGNYFELNISYSQAALTLYTTLTELTPGGNSVAYSYNFNATAVLNCSLGSDCTAYIGMTGK